MTKNTRASILIALAMGTFALAACQARGPSLGDDPPAAGDPLQEDPTGRFCGGFGGFPCPEGYACIDDPSDDCDPQRGGADCSGICVLGGLSCERPGRLYVSHEPDVCAATMWQCPPGFVQFFDACGCGCEPGWPVEEGCRENVCGPDEYCCNPSCGICAPLGGACIQVECK